MLPSAAFAGEGRCLDAFVVALDQACGGGAKRWYASTLELRLVSLEFCRACRSIPTLAVKVEGSTPRSLWTRQNSKTGPNTRSSEVRISSRVPVERALRLTWGPPLEFLAQSAAVDLWALSVCVQLTGSVRAASLALVVRPQALKRLSFEYHLVLQPAHRWS